MTGSIGASHVGETGRELAHRLIAKLPEWPLRVHDRHRVFRTQTPNSDPDSAMANSDLPVGGEGNDQKITLDHGVPLGGGAAAGGAGALLTSTGPGAVGWSEWAVRDMPLPLEASLAV